MTGSKEIKCYELYLTANCIHSKFQKVSYREGTYNRQTRSNGNLLVDCSRAVAHIYYFTCILSVKNEFKFNRQLVIFENNYYRSEQ